MSSIHNYKARANHPVNIKQLLAELPEGCQISVFEDVDVVVHTPDGIDEKEVQRIVKAHAPSKTNEETLIEDERSELDKAIEQSPYIKSLVSRITALEKKNG